MKKYLLGVAAMALGATSAVAGTSPVVAGAAAAPQAAAAATPTRINRIIQVWETGQPVYYTQVSGGGYEEGKKLAATKADYITYDMEHGSLDFSALRAFMQGLVDAGTTRTGHRTPAVIVTLPVLGDDPVSMKANAWVAQQVLAAGAHGILLCQAESPEAVRILVQELRYPFAPGADPKVTHRGNGSQAYASKIWGVSGNEYLRRADLWPLNKDGEILLGLKIENPKAVAHSEELAKIPGVAFVEWGPGDQAMYLVGMPKEVRVVRDAQGSPVYVDGSNNHPPAMVAARARVLAASKAAGIKFLNACPDDDVINQLKEGAMICTGGDTPAADKGRAFTKRQQPW